jgi:clan AA aspartic protease
MGTFHVAVEVGNLAGDRFEMVEALVDTSASDSIFPGSLLRALGIEPTDRARFRLADERRVEFEVGMGRLRLYGKERASTVVFGDEGMEPILGAVALEEFHLGVDPMGRRLIEMDGLLMTLLDT